MLVGTNRNSILLTPPTVIIADPCLRPDQKLKQPNRAGRPKDIAEMDLQIVDFCLSLNDNGVAMHVPVATENAGCQLGFVRNVLQKPRHVSVGVAVALQESLPLRS